MEAIMELIEMELKYCERCGGLWLRELGSEEIYCAPCLAKLEGLPSPRLKRGPHSEHVEGLICRDAGARGSCMCAGKGAMHERHSVKKLGGSRR